jgi:hypothetical protein
MVGFVEVITLLLGLAGFGLTPNPKAATADQALHYAMPDADIVVHVDVASVVPNNYKLLLALPSQPSIKNSPELVKMMQKVINEVEGARGIAKSSTGIDPASDVSDGTLFVKFVAANKDPDWLATSRGKYTPAVLDNVAKLTRKPVVKVGGGAIIELGPNAPAIGITKDNVLLAGVPKLVRDRLADTWKPPARPPNTQLGWAQEAINGKPVFALVVSLSQGARKAIASEMGPKKNFVSDLASRHKVFAFSVYHDGIGWTWVDNGKAGMEQLATMSEGMIELMRAAHIAPRGIAKILLGALDSYKGVDKRVDEVIKRKGDLMKVVETYTGDGTFKATVNRDPAKNRVDVRATGKSLSDVLPAGFALPVAGLVLFGVGGVKKSPTPPTQMPMPPVQPAKRP